MTAILFVHGLSATNHIFDGLMSMFGKKYKVYNPMLPGHGVSPEALQKTKYSQMVDFLKEYTKPILKKHKKVIVIAESFGTNIVLDAIDEKKIQGMICLGTVLKIRNRLLLSLFHRAIKLLRPNYYYKKAQGHPRVVKGTTYDRLHVDTVGMFIKENKRLKHQIKSCSFPLLFIYAQDDDLINIPWKRKFLRGLSNDKIELVEFESKTHAILETDHVGTISDHISDFVSRYGTSSRAIKRKVKKVLA